MKPCKMVRRSACLLLWAWALGTASAGAADNVVDLIYDPAGNIVQIHRQAASGLSVTGFEPASGLQGSTVTVFGTGFSSTPAANTVRFNGVAAVVSAAASGSLSVTVPVGAQSGRLSVTVGAATSVSTQDFLVLVAGAPTVSGFSPGIAGPGASVTVTGGGFTPAGSISLALNTTPATANVIDASSLQFSVPPSAASGRIFVTNPSGTGFSAQDLIVPPAGYAAGDVATSIRLAPGGPPASFGIGTAAKHGVLLFDGNADTYYTVQFGQLVHSPSSATLPYAVYKPDNTLLASGYLGNGYRPTVHLPRLPAGGTYSVFVSPGVATMSSQVSVAADPVLALEAAPSSVAMGSPSQTTRSVFDAVAGQSLGIGVTGYVQNASSSTYAGFNLVLPNGTVMGGGPLFLAYWTWSSNPAGNWDGEFTAPATGRYQLIAQPVAGYAASYGISLNSEVTGSLVPDVAAEFTLARAGQDARFTFAASPGDSRAIDLALVNPQPVAHTVNYRIHKPDGSLWVQGSTSPPSNGSQTQLPPIPVAGDYAVVVDPMYGMHGGMRLALKQGALLGVADAPLPFGTAANGETARFRFQGTTGQNLSVGIAGLAYVGTSSGYATLAVHKPDGTQLSYTNCYPTTAGGLCRMSLANLPSTGTYAVTLQPPAGVRAAGSITLSADAAGTLVENTPVPVAISRTGQYARFHFAGTAGQSTAIELSQLQVSPTGLYVYVSVLKPDGSILSSSSGGSGGVFVPLPALPVSGTYTVVVDGSGAGWTGRLSLKSGIPTSVGGSPLALATMVTGEVARYTFAGAAGTKVEIGLSGLAYDASSSGATTASLYRPDAGYIAGAYCYTATAGGGCEIITPATLPVTGNYSLVLSPPAGRVIAAGTLAVSSPATGALTVGGAPQAAAIARPGQTARYTFGGTAAQLLRLSWADVTVSIPAAGTVSVTVLKPDGGWLASGSFGHAATGGIDLPALPVTGAYTVVFDPASAATLSANVGLVAR